MRRDVMDPSVVPCADREAGTLSASNSGDLMLCGCGRGEASPYAIRTLGQWMEACDQCAVEFVDSQRRTAFESHWTFSPTKTPPHIRRFMVDPIPGAFRCDWCSSEDPVIGRISRGRNSWWICYTCYVINTGGQHPDRTTAEERRSRLRDDLSDLRAMYAELFGTDRPAAPRLPAPFDEDPANAFLFHTNGAVFPPGDGLEGIYAVYHPAARPTRVAGRRGLAVVDAPGFHLGAGTSFDVYRGSRWYWLLGHDGIVYPNPESTPSDAASRMLSAWLETGDPWRNLVRREAASILATWEPDGPGRLAPWAAGSTRQQWDLRMTRARLAAVKMTGTDRERALDALCGLGYHGDRRPDLIPTPEELSTATWPIHPIVPMSADDMRRHPHD